MKDCSNNIAKCSGEYWSTVLQLSAVSHACPVLLSPLSVCLTHLSQVGYTSFFYPLDLPPRNAVEQLIQALRRYQLGTSSSSSSRSTSASGGTGIGSSSELVGAEWWVHTRVHGEEGHQLHFDMDEIRLR